MKCLVQCLAQWKHTDSSQKHMEDLTWGQELKGPCSYLATVHIWYCNQQFMSSASSNSFQWQEIHWRVGAPYGPNQGSLRATNASWAWVCTGWLAYMRSCKSSQITGNTGPSQVTRLHIQVLLLSMQTAFSWCPVQFTKVPYHHISTCALEHSFYESRCHNRLMSQK